MKIQLLLILVLAGFKLTAQNLVVNGDCEQALVNGEIPAWLEMEGTDWGQRISDPEPQSGVNYFYPGSIARGELRQTIDISAFSCRIDAGEQHFRFSGYTRSFDQSPADECNMNIAFFNADNFLVGSSAFGPFATISTWQLTDTVLLAPAGARSVIIYLISIRKNGSNNDGYYDNISLVPIENEPCASSSSAFAAIGSDTCSLPFIVNFTDLSANAPSSWNWFFEGAESDSSTEANPAGIQYNTPGSYDVTLITCNTFGCDTLTLADFIRVSGPPEAPQISNADNSLFATGEGAFQWFERNEPEVVLATDSVFVPESGGVYFVVLTDENGCSATSDDFPYSGVSVHELQQENGFTLFPNPVQSELYVQLSQSFLGQGVFCIKSISGQSFGKKIIRQMPFVFDTSQLSPGMYIVEYQDDHVVYTRKFIKD